MRKGIFLVEALVALAILSVVIGSLMQGVTAGIQGSLAGRQDMQATVLVETVAEEVRAVSASGTWGTDVWVPVSDGIHLAADGAWHDLTPATEPPLPLNASCTIRYRATFVTSADLPSRMEIAFPPIASPPLSKTATGIIASASVSRLSSPNLVDLATATFWNPGPIRPGFYELTFWREYFKFPPGTWNVEKFTFDPCYCIYASGANYPFCWELQASNNVLGGWNTIDQRQDTFCVPGWNKFALSAPPSPDKKYFRLLVPEYEGAGLSLGELYFPGPTDPVPGEPYVPATPTYDVRANVHTSSAWRLADGEIDFFYNPPKQVPAGPYIIDFWASSVLQVQQYRLFCTDDWFPTSWRLLGWDGTATHTLHVGTAATWAAQSWVTFDCSLLTPVNTFQLIVDSWSGIGLSMGEVDFIPSPPPPPPPLFIPPATLFHRFAGANVDNGNAGLMVDNTPDSFWNTTLQPPPVSGPEVYLIDLIAPYPFVASQCTMYCASSNNPRNFRLSGRTAAGTWQLLNTWTNETWPLEGWRTFDFPEPAAPASFATWRLQIDAYNGVGVSIAEFDFPHKYVRAVDPNVYLPQTLVRVEVFVQPAGAADPTEGSRLQFLVGRRGAEP